jgi:transmembrane sensor
MAGGLIVGILATGWGVQRSYPMADFHTRTGERRTVSLPGGVTAMLASDTALSLMDGYGCAGVELHHGEVWFDHGPQSGDFFVASSGGHCWSRGGQFDIARFDDETTVTVESNSIAVKLGNQIARVAANHALTYQPDKLGPVRDVDVANMLAWRNGQLVFMGEQLGDVARVLERWQSGQIVILGDDVARRKVTMVVDLDRTRDVLPALAGALSLKVDQFTDYLTVIRAA